LLKGRGVAMRHEQLMEEANRLLEKHGFKSAVNRLPSETCLDIVASSGPHSLVIKTARNLEDVDREHAEELCAISSWAGASPIVLAERFRGEELDDDAVYLRNGTYALSIGALERTLEGDPPIVEVGPIGCFVYINGETVRKRREELGLSAGELARLVGVSRMTIYSYERGRRRTTPSVAYRLEYVLGIPIVVPVNPLSAETKHKDVLGGERVREGQPLEGFLKTVIEVMRKLRLAARALTRAPFEMMAGRGRIRLAVNIVCREDYEKARIEFTKKFAEITGLKHLVVKPEGYECPEDVPSVGIEELKSARGPKDIVRLLTT